MSNFDDDQKGIIIVDLLPALSGRGGGQASPLVCVRYDRRKEAALAIGGEFTAYTVWAIVNYIELKDS